jgi:hypothetical protein
MSNKTVNKKALTEVLTEWAENEKKIAPIEAKLALLHKRRNELQKKMGAFVLPDPATPPLIPSFSVEGVVDLTFGTKVSRAVDAAGWINGTPSKKRDEAFFETVKVQIEKAEKFDNKLFESLVVSTTKYSLNPTLLNTK